MLLFPGMRFLTLLGLYALRLLWTGVHPLMGAPRSKVLPYSLAIAVIAFVIMFAMAFSFRRWSCLFTAAPSGGSGLGRPAVRPCAAAMIALASMP